MATLHINLNITLYPVSCWYYFLHHTKFDKYCKDMWFLRISYSHCWINITLALDKYIWLSLRNTARRFGLEALRSNIMHLPITPSPSITPYYLPRWEIYSVGLDKYSWPFLRNIARRIGLQALRILQHYAFAVSLPSPSITPATPAGANTLHHKAINTLVQTIPYFVGPKMIAHRGTSL